MRTKLAIGSGHAGFILMNGMAEYLKYSIHPMVDVGTHAVDSVGDCSALWLGVAGRGEGPDIRRATDWASEERRLLKQSSLS